RLRRQAGPSLTRAPSTAPAEPPPGRFVFPTAFPAGKNRVLNARPARRPPMAATMPQRSVRNAEEATPDQTRQTTLLLPGEPCVQNPYAPHCVNRASAERLGLAARLRRTDDFPPNLERTGCADAPPHYTCAEERVI